MRGNVLLSAFFMLMAVLAFVIVPQVVYRMPSDYMLDLEVVSIDNFFDDELGEYSGESLSASILQFESKNTDQLLSNPLTLDALLHISTLTGEEIISVEHTYSVDPNTRQIVSMDGEVIDEGVYLFAPRHVKPEQEYQYWHVSDSNPVTMQYVAMEQVHGLDVYHFQGTVVTDQTAEVSNILDLAENESVIKEGTFSVWVDIHSGALVNYSDEAVVRITDSETGDHVRPRNYYRNTLTRNSVAAQAQLAARAHALHQAFGIVLPIGLVLIALLSLFMGFVMHSHQTARILIHSLAVLLVCITTAVSFTTANTIQRDTLTVGIARWITADRFDRNVEAFKASLANAGYVEGEHIEYQEIIANADPELFDAGVQDFIDNDVDLIYTMTTPGVLRAQKLTDTIPIIFSVVTHPVEANVIDSLTNSMNNTVGVRHSVDQAEYLRLTKELFPKSKRMVFIHGADQLNSVAQAEELLSISENYAMELTTIAATSGDEARSELLSIIDETDIVYIGCDSFMQQSGTDVVLPLVQERNIPMISCTEGLVARGVLFALTRNFSVVGRLAGEQAAILMNKDVDPALMETLTPAHYDTHLNEAVAEELGVTIPQNVLLEATTILYE